MNTQTIPEEVISLLQYVELNQSDWWDKAIQRLIIGIIWHSNKQLDTQGLVQEIRLLLGIKLSLSKIEENVNRLCEKKDLIILHNRTLKIPEKRLDEFSAELEKAERIQEAAKVNFIENLSSRISHLPSNRADEMWTSFNNTLLIPMIQKLGARTYSLISGARLNSEEMPIFKEYIERQPAILRDAIRASILSFMDSNNPIARKFIIRHLNARFFVEASQLKEKTLRKINEMIEGKPTFNIFLDTNFLFSLLNLHDNPSSEAALSLINLIGTISNFADVNLYVYPLTIDEAKVVIKGTLQTCKGINFQDNLTDAVIETEAELTGMIRKYAQEKKKRGVTPEQYFQPYLLQLIELISQKGVHLYNEDVELLRNNQVIKGEIEFQIELQKRHLDRKQKSYFTLEHDIVLWYFIKALRPARVETPVNAKYWVATIDFGLLAYDAHKRKHNSEEVPICLHPTALIHMLQFWVPRDEAFDKAILDSLRLPFLFQAFDEKDELITSDILSTISSIGNMDKFSVKMITSLLMNRALRQKIVNTPNINERIKVVKEFIETEEAKLRQEITELHEVKKLNEEKQKELLSIIDKQKADLVEAEFIKTELAQKIKEGEEQNIAQNIARKSRNSFVVNWLLIPFGLNIFLSGLLNRFDGFFFGATWKTVYSLIFFVSLLFLHVLVADSAGRKKPTISNWVHFEKFHNIKKWIVGSLFTLLGSLIADALYDYLKSKFTGV